MSVMFRPPVTSAPLGWRQVLGFGQGRDAIYGRIRAAQLQALNRYVPFNVALLTTNVVALLYTLRGIAAPGFLIGWGGGHRGADRPLGAARSRHAPAAANRPMSASASSGWSAPKSSPSACAGRR